MTEHDTEVWIIAPQGAECTLVVEATPDNVMGTVQVLDPLGVERGRWRVDAEWLMQAAGAMMEAAGLLRTLRPVDNPVDIIRHLRGTLWHEGRDA